jgi:hypothetical protein
VLRAPRVLVVDDVPDLAEVLSAVLKPRGLEIRRVRLAERESAADPDDRPALVIFDAQVLPAEEPLAPPFEGVPQIVIASGQTPLPRPGRQVLSKPYQIAELIRAVESLTLAHAG